MADTETTRAAVREIKVSLATVDEGGATHGGFDAALAVHFALILLDELARDDAEHFFYTLTIFGADLVAAVPDVFLTPEATAPIAMWRGHGGKICVAGWRAVKSAGRASVDSADLVGIELFGDVADAPLEGHLALGGVFGDDIALCAYDMQDQVLTVAPARFVA